MTEKNSRFIWNEEKKNWLKTWQPKLRRDVNKLTEQVSRFKKALPHFAQEAENAAQPFLESGSLLLRLSWKNKFNPLSPEEAEVEFNKIREKFALWTAFTNRTEVSQTIAEINRKVQTAKREQQTAWKEAERLFLTHINTEEFEKSIQSQAATVTEQLKQMAILAISLASYGHKEDLPVLQRLLLLHFVRSIYDFDPPVKEAVAHFLSENPSAKAADLLMCVIRSVIVERTKSHLQRSRSFIPGFNDPISHIAACRRQVLEDGLKLFKKWKEQGTTPTGINKGHFMVQGYDFSLTAKPV